MVISGEMQKISRSADFINKIRRKGGKRPFGTAKNISAAFAARKDLFFLNNLKLYSKITHPFIFLNTQRPSPCSPKRARAGVFLGVVKRGNFAYNIDETIVLQNELRRDAR